MTDKEELITDTIDEAKADISALDTQKELYEAQLAAKDAKYAELLKAYSRGERAKETSEAHDPTPAELKKDFENNVLSLQANKESDLEQAKRLISIRNYRKSIGEPDIFLPQDGTPSNVDIESANNVGDLLETAIEQSDGDDAIFRAIVQSHLVDNKNIRRF